MTPPDQGKYNVVVIGGGTAGLVTAAGTAGLGGRVALIERGKMGGDCLNFGCVPSKALISSARLLARMRRAEDWGVRAVEPQFDFEKVMARMRAKRAEIAPHDSQERFESLGVDVFRGDAKFISRDAVRVGETTLRAQNFVIATGSRATIPKIEGLDRVRYFTNETIFDELKAKPESMIVLGGGPIGCELGQTFARLGVPVTIVQRGPRLLPREDREVSEFLAQQLRAEGLTILTDTEAKSVAQINDGIELHISGGDQTKISAAALLICIGRTPRTDGVGLPEIGVATDEHGVKTNEYLQTTQPHIYAAGDVAGPFLFTHMADAQARVAVRNILMPLQILRQKIDYGAVPWCTYVDPEIATVGLTESSAREKNISYDLLTEEIAELDRAVVESETRGFVRLLLAKGSDKILGATIVCDHAGDLLQEFVLAMKYGIGLGKIAATIHPYPTFAELARKAGDKYNRTRLTPTAKKIFAWLYRRQLR